MHPLKFIKILKFVLAFLFLNLSVGVAHSKAQSGTQDIGWPRQVTDHNGTLTYYQPQIDKWSDYKSLTARMAFSLKQKTGREVLGVASLNCETLVDKDKRMVYLKNLQIPEVRFPSLNPDSVKIMGSVFRKIMPTDAGPI